MTDPDQGSGSLKFANAVRRAASGLTIAHVELYKQASLTSQELIAILLSDEPLSGVDREYLAEFIAGEFRKRTGRQPRSKAANKERQAIDNDYRALMEGMKNSISGKPSQQVAIDFLCAKYRHLSREQIVQITRHRTMRVSQTRLPTRKKTPG